MHHDRFSLDGIDDGRVGRLGGLDDGGEQADKFAEKAHGWLPGNEYLQRRLCLK